jgi:hypothetical protein
LSYASVAGGGGGDQNGRIYLTAAMELGGKKVEGKQKTEKTGSPPAGLLPQLLLLVVRVYLYVDRS